MNLQTPKIISHLESKSLDSYLVTHPVNLFYLTGYPSHDAWGLIHGKRLYFLTDPRYSHEAKHELKGVSVVECRQSLLRGFTQLSVRLRARRIGFDSRHISFDLFRMLKKGMASAGSKLVIFNGLIEALREIKQPEEIQQIRACIRLNLLGFRELRRYLRPGLTEKNVLSFLDKFVRVHGAGFSFDPIIASGPQSSYPHAQVTDRKIRLNEPLLIDFGICMNGYKSDLTRMFFLGKIPPSHINILNNIKTAQQKAYLKIRPGIQAREVDQEARNFLRRNKLGKNFVHSLGHGVGLEIHESPRLSEKSDAVLKQGMVVTIEPGVYFPQRFGIRVEDMALVTENGCEMLSNEPEGKG